MPNRDQIVQFLKELKEKIRTAFEAFEESVRFEKIPWEYTTGGGGERGRLRGNVFEKAAVNWSGISGPNFPMQDGSGPFFATGVSLITHMHNPHAPTVHMNVRYIETEKGHWFGGGYDLTPMGFPYAEDTAHFHRVAKENLDPLGAHLYPELSANAKTYFYIPHRKKERGVGGLFFDHLNTGDYAHDLAVWQAVANSFLPAILPIYARRVAMPFTEEEKELQLKMRAHYVEFNLLYDRGTKFGFLSGGNPDAILDSLPPVVTW